MKKINYVNGDLFDNIPESPIVIAHVCNDKGAWGAGFVIPLADHFPTSKHCYLEWHKNGSPVQGALSTEFCKRGGTQFVETEGNVWVANMVAQTLGGERPLFYNDLALCMDRVAYFVFSQLENKGEIICPMFGSGLAGGDWNFVEKLIEDCWTRKDIDVTVCYLPQFLPDNWSPPQ